MPTLKDTCPTRSIAVSKEIHLAYKAKCSREGKHMQLVTEALMKLFIEEGISVDVKVTVK